MVSSRRIWHAVFWSTVSIDSFDMFYIGNIHPPARFAPRLDPQFEVLFELPQLRLVSHIDGNDCAVELEGVPQDMLSNPN
jgi:hypothetical protein